MNIFLNKYKTITEYTNTSIIGGKWNIPDNQYNNFLKYYSQELDKGVELYLTEKHIPEQGPIIIDFDFRYEYKGKIIKSPLTAIILDKIVNNIIKIIESVYGEEVNNICVLLKRPVTYLDEKNNQIKDGIHIQFPYLVTTYDFQHSLRNKYLEIMENDLKEIPYINSLSDIYDKAVIGCNPWFLYGSTKKKIPHYEIIKIYNSDTNYKDLTNLNKVKLLSIRNKGKYKVDTSNNNIYIKFIKKYNNNTKIVEKKTITKKDHVNNKTQIIKHEKSPCNVQYNKYNNMEIDDIEKLLSLLSSSYRDNYDEWLTIGAMLYNYGLTYTGNSLDLLNIWDKWSKSSNKYGINCCKLQWNKFKPTAEKKSKVGKLIKYVITDNVNNYEKFCEYKILKYASSLLHEPVSVKSNYSHENSYYFLLNNKFCPIAQHEHDLPCMYIEACLNGIALKCNNFESKCINKIYPIEGYLNYKNGEKELLFINCNITNITIINNNSDQKDIDCLEFNPDVTILSPDKKLNILLLNGLNNTASDIAEIVYYLYPNTIYSNGKDKEWYEFRGHKWSKKGGIRKYVKVVKEYYSKILLKYQDTEDKGLIKKISNVRINLGNTFVINNIITELANLYKENIPDFEDKLDKNKYLLGFNNGVYDLLAHEFRDGIYTDYITMSVGYDYDPSPIYVDELYKIINQILPNIKVRDYLLTIFSLCLSAETVQKIFFLEGTGSNGKSLLQKLLSKTLNDYMGTMNTSYIVSKRQEANDCSPQLFKTINTRCLIFSEPNKNDILNEGVIKELTGNDTLTVRTLHKEPIKYETTFKIFVLTNYLPQIDGTDDAIWRRVVNIKFLSRFVDNPNKNNPNEYQINYALYDKLEDYKTSFIHILLSYWKKYKDNGSKIEEPTEVLEETKKYKEVNNHCKDYCNLFIKKDENSGIVWNELYAAYREWHNLNFKEPIQGARKCKEEFIKHCFLTDEVRFRRDNIRCYGWKGYLLVKELDDRIDNSDSDSECCVFSDS